ncbi:MAG: acyl-CoA dehydrogenase family protein [Novosphingobium sp.]
MHDYLGLDQHVLTEDHRLLRQQVQAFLREHITPLAPEWEKTGRVPAATFWKLGEAGLLSIAFPVADGGLGMDTIASVILNEELGRTGFGGLTASISVHTDMTALHLVRAGNAEQRQRLLPDILTGKRICGLGVTEPRGGSDLTRIATTARRDGDDYVLNGAKLFITNASFADIFFVIAKTDQAVKGGSGFSLFIIERGMPGFSNGQRFEKTGWHSSDTGELRFDNVRVPAANLIGEEGRGFYYMMAGLDHERICAAAQAIGLADAAMDLTLDWVRQREAYGKTLWDLQVIRHEMAKLATELLSARTLLYAVAQKAARGERLQLEGSMLKAYIPEFVNRLTYKCVQFHGGMGYMSETPVERISRDARILAIGGGASEVMYDEVAKRL